MWTDLQKLLREVSQAKCYLRVCSESVPQSNTNDGCCFCPVNFHLSKSGEHGLTMVNCLFHTIVAGPASYPAPLLFEWLEGHSKGKPSQTTNFIQNGLTTVNVAVTLWLFCDAEYYLQSIAMAEHASLQLLVSGCQDAGFVHGQKQQLNKVGKPMFFYVLE